MVKRFAVFMLTLVLVMSVSSVAFGASPESDFEFDSSTGTITKYVGPGGAVEIPSTIGGVAVNSIGEWSFFGCTNLTSATIPSSVVSISDAAFFDCSSLTTVTIPSSVTLIGESAFFGCTNLASISIPSSVTFIGGEAFAHCSSLTTVIIPDSIHSVGDSTFQSCTSLVSVTIPTSVTSIGDNAFFNCSSLSSITIPNSVTYLGDSAFLSCTALTSVTISNRITSLSRFAFSGCTSLRSVTIPATVTSINYRAFYGCTALKSALFEGEAPLTFGTAVFGSCASNFAISYYSNQARWSTPYWRGYRTIPISTNAYLSKLTASTGKWNYRFSKTRYNYLLVIGSTKSSVKVTAYKAQTNAKVYWSYNKATWYAGSAKTVSVSRGQYKNLYFKVKAQSGATRIYKVRVYRKR